MKIFAHRGSSLLWPENTFLAFDYAHEAGATGFETDLRLSHDQEIILSHDDNLARVGRPEKTIGQLTRAEISDVEIYSPDGRLTDRIITLRQLLQKYPQKDYILDCKISAPRLFEALKQLLAELSFHERIWFLTWSAQGDNHVRRVFPGYALFPRYNRLVHWGLASTLRLGRLLEPGNQIVSLPAYHKGLRVFSRRQVQKLQADGRIFMGYLVNTERAFRWCQACGIKHYLTDRPDLLGKLL